MVAPEVRAYYFQHRAVLEKVLSKSVDETLHERPPEPLGFIANLLHRRAFAGSVSEPPPPQGEGVPTEEEALARLTSAPLERFARRVAALVDDELGPLVQVLAAEFDASAEAGGASTAAPALVAAMPTELKVACVADVCNRAYDALRAPLLRATQNHELVRVVGEEAMGELKLVSRIAAAAHAKVECGVKFKNETWRAPAAMDEMKAAAANMAAVQKRAVVLIEEDKEAEAAPLLDDLFEEVARTQLPLYKVRVEELHADDGEELYATLPRVVGDLLPKFEKSARAPRCRPLSFVRPA